LSRLLLKKLKKNRGITGREAFELLYSSFLYSKLEQERTKLWHLSPVTLATLLDEELETGSIRFPEEA
jgi:hypothetical protein